MTNSETVATLLDRHAELKREFEIRHKAFIEAKEAYHDASAVIVDFERKFGRIISLFED